MNRGYISSYVQKWFEGENQEELAVKCPRLYVSERTMFFSDIPYLVSVIIETLLSPRHVHYLNDSCTIWRCTSEFVEKHRRDFIDRRDCYNDKLANSVLSPAFPDSQTARRWKIAKSEAKEASKQTVDQIWSETLVKSDESLVFRKKKRTFAEAIEQKDDNNNSPPTLKTLQNELAYLDASEEHKREEDRVRTQQRQERQSWYLESQQRQSWQEHQRWRQLAGPVFTSTDMPRQPLRPVNTGNGMPQRNPDPPTAPKTTTKKVVPPNFPTEADVAQDVAAEKTDDKRCVYCITNISCCVNAPCMHLCYCSGCSRELFLKSSTSVLCAVCRQPVDSSKRVYFS